MCSKRTNRSFRPKCENAWQVMGDDKGGVHLWLYLSCMEKNGPRAPDWPLNYRTASPEQEDTRLDPSLTSILPLISPSKTAGFLTQASPYPCPTPPVMNAFDRFVSSIPIRSKLFAVATGDAPTTKPAPGEASVST